MAAELIRGQNHPLTDTRLEIRVSAGQPVLAGLTLNDDQGRRREAAWIAHPAAPRLPGIEVSRQAAADHRLAVDLGILLPGFVRTQGEKRVIENALEGLKRRVELG